VGLCLLHKGQPHISACVRSLLNRKIMEVESC
jgi:hypothetical protein